VVIVKNKTARFWASVQ